MKEIPLPKKEEETNKDQILREENEFKNKEEGEIINFDPQRIIRKKVEIPKGLSTKEIIEKIKKEYGFEISRSTTWRAQKRGYLIVGYHQKLIDHDPNWVDSHIEEIEEAARLGAFRALMQHGMSPKELYGAIDFEDLVSEGKLRIIELSGDPNINSREWKIAVARNAAGNLIDKFITTKKYSAERTPRSLEEDIL